MLLPIHFLPYFVCLVLFASIDFLWLFTTNQMYKKYLMHLLGANVNWMGVLLFYPLYAMGIYLFVVKPFGQQSSLMNLFLQGAFFGVVTYGTYDLTNYATLKEWPAVLVVIDVLWGAFLTGLVSIATVSILKWIS